MEPKSIKLRNDATLTIREAKKKDAAYILEYVNRIAGETDFFTFGPGEFDLSLEQEEQFIEKHLNSENKLFVIAQIDQELVGNLGFTGGDRPRLRHAGEFGCGVLKEYWGLGIGSGLVEILIDWARSSGIIRKINLKVRLDNERAIKLYERFGFVREGLISRESFFDGQFYDHIIMGLQID